MQIIRIGLDLAKYVFEVHGVNAQDEVVLRKTLRRDAVPQFFADLQPCVIGMEACCGAHYWAMVFTDLGHEVRLISPQFVKPYVKSNKNDRNDAEAICEAIGRPSMRFVPPKSAEQLEIQVRYAGYLGRQQEDIERRRRHENTTIPEGFDYGRVRGLSSEVCEKLERVSPDTVGQASRIPGMTPAAISLLLVYLKKDRQQVA